MLVLDAHPIMKPYRGLIWLRVIHDRNVTVRLGTTAAIPPFETTISAYVNDPDLSINYVPIIIQGIGTDGTTRNQTAYVLYQSPKDLVNQGVILGKIGEYASVASTI